MAKPTHESKTRLLDTAMHVIRAKGYAATTIDDICAGAGLTKGSFFHHFKSKEELALAASGHFAAMAEGLLTGADCARAEDPLERVRGYLALRAALVAGDPAAWTCLLGTLVQETWDTHPAIRTACGQHIGAHVDWLARDLAAAKARHAPDADWCPASLARFTQAALQGGFVLAKAAGEPGPAAESVAHLRRYIDLLFANP